MRHLPIVAIVLSALAPGPARAAGIVLADKGKSVRVIELRMFLVWDAGKESQALSVQPIITGDAKRVAWFLPTPQKPRLHEMPRDFCETLATFTYPEAMDARFAGKPEPVPFRFPPPPKIITVHADRGLSFGDFAIFEPEHVGKLRDWARKYELDEARVEELLVPVLKRGGYLTAFAESAEQLRRNPKGVFENVMVAPIRFAYPTKTPHLPLELTKHCITDPIRWTLYTAATTKMDLPGDYSYQPTWLDKWTHGMKTLAADKRTAAEKDWLTLADAESATWRKTLANDKREPTMLRYAKRLTEDDMKVMAGKAPYTREAPRELIQRMVHLRGHLLAGQFVTQMDRTLTARDLESALAPTAAQVGGKMDEMSHVSLLPVRTP